MKFEESAKRLKEAMTAKGLRQQDLADLSGVSKSNISHYIHGRHCPDNERAFKLAQILDVDPLWLMAIDEVPEVMLVKRDELSEIIETFNDMQRERLLEYAKKLQEFVDGGSDS